MTRHTCPSSVRARTGLPPADQWETGRWTTDHEAAEAARKKALATWAASVSPVMDEWVWETPVPRTCSYCGGIHPEDAIVLLAHGWEVQPTDKAYKRYIQPPGHKLAHRALIRDIKSQRGPLDGPMGMPEYHTPVPPVKLYTWHMNEDQIERFNAALKGI